MVFAGSIVSVEAVGLVRMLCMAVTWLLTRIVSFLLVKEAKPEYIVRTPRLDGSTGYHCMIKEGQA